MAYLDIDRLVEVALEAGCDAVHPGYGFLAESAEFAHRCAEAGLVFVGPTPEQLGLFGDKGRARAAATAAGVPTLRGLDRAVTVEEAGEFLAGLDGGSMMIQGGRRRWWARHARCRRGVRGHHDVRALCLGSAGRLR